MIPLMPTVALAFISLCCSAFVVFRILLSILPRRYLGRRVYPSTFSRPSSHHLPPADKSYVWLALCDVVAVSMLVWEAFIQWADSSSGAAASTAAFRVGSAARLWLALTFRQTCFLVVSVLILTHVRMRKSVSFGRVHWFLWVPLAFLTSVFTIAVVLFTDDTTATTSTRRFLVGILVYLSAIAVLNTVMFGSFVSSLVAIKRSLTNFNQVTVSKESKSPGGTVENPHVSLTSEDIDVVREGSSWITSPASSRRRKSDSPNSHSTPTRTRATQNMPASPEPGPAITAPFPFSSSQDTHPPTSPRTPARRRDDTHAKTDFGPVHDRTRSFQAVALTPTSRGSWISSSLGTRPPLPAWSYPSTPRSSPRDRVQSAISEQSAIASTSTRNMGPSSARPCTTSPAIGGPVGTASDVQYAPSAQQAERGTASPTSTARSPQIEISMLRIVAWLAGVWVPLILSFPYLTGLHGPGLQNSELKSTFLVISVTISSPILVLNLLLRHPIEIPYGVFDAPPAPRSIIRSTPSIGSASTSEGHRRGSGTKAGRRSRYAWLSKDSTVGGKGYRTRFPRVLAPAPRLSILPVSNHDAKRPMPLVPCQSGPDSHLVQSVAPQSPAPTRSLPADFPPLTHTMSRRSTCNIYQSTQDNLATETLPFHRL